MPEPSIGVVIINWNGADDTIAALESLVTASPGPACVVVIDNGSADDSLNRIRAWCSTQSLPWVERGPDVVDTSELARWLTLIAATDNLGFSGANNLGLRYLADCTPASHFLLLNNDAMVAPDYFRELTSAIREAPSAGIIGSLIYRHPDRGSVWYAGAVEIPWRALIVHTLTPTSLDQPYQTTFVTGCAMAISRPLYEKLGGLAEVYNPIYWEDAEYSRRAYVDGWTLLVAPRAHVYHRVGASGQGERLTPRTAFLQNRNRALYVRRNYRGADRWIALAYLAATKPARAVVEIARGRAALGSAIFRGFLRGVTQST